MCYLCRDQRDLDVAEVNRAVRDNNARLQNWALLLRSLNSYYQVGHYGGGGDYLMNTHMLTPTQRSVGGGGQHVCVHQAVTASAVWNLKKTQINLFTQLWSTMEY